MVLQEEKYELDGKEILLRSANENADDANMLIDYLKTVTGETRFLMCEPDEVKYTTEGELSFIKEHNESENGLLILAFVDGEYAGNCSFEGKTSSRRQNTGRELPCSRNIQALGWEDSCWKSCSGR